jgi:hypothetical protein
MDAGAMDGLGGVAAFAAAAVVVGNVMAGRGDAVGDTGAVDAPVVVAAGLAGVAAGGAAADDAAFAWVTGASIAGACTESLTAPNEGSWSRAEYRPNATSRAPPSAIVPGRLKILPCTVSS